MTDFDPAAARYDRSFTHTLIGRAQRNRVRDMLDKILCDNPIKKVLEINCGTGEDAIWLGDKGLEVTATDISPQMIAQSQSKSYRKNVSFLTADINQLPGPFANDRFDLIFSNFGGLNCLSPIRLELFFKHASLLLPDGAKMLLVLMPRNTKWEQAYFLVKKDFAQVFRRKKPGAIAQVDGQTVLTYYYNPREIAALAEPYFACGRVNPIGFFVPPSYLEPYFARRKKLFSVLDHCERQVYRLRFLASHSDHYGIEFTKR